MIKFEFTVNNIKHQFDTIEDLHAAKDMLNNKGNNVDLNSIKIIDIKVPKTIKSLTNLVKDNISNIEDIEDCNIVELIDGITYDIVKEFSQKQILTKKEYNILTGVYGEYSYCDNIDEVKTSIILDVISQILYGNNTSYSKYKNMIVNKCI